MGKWLDKFSNDIQGSRPDSPDTMDSVSGVSGPSSKCSVKNPLPQVAEPPTAPLVKGWLITYRNRVGQLCGGCDDRLDGTVQECRWDEGHWLVRLTNGATIPLSAITSVAKTDSTGLVLAAWTTREHGYDGEGANRQGSLRLPLK